MHAVFRWELEKERDYKEVVDIDRRIILKWSLDTWNGVTWTRFVVWLRTGTRGELLWSRQ
jgi:hypothetical protein